MNADRSAGTAREALTAPQRDFVDRFERLIREDGRFVGLAVGGSWLSNEMDRFSDLDFILVSEEDQLDDIRKTREALAAKMGGLLTAFTGEHVGEPRMIICLYGPPLLHVDMKFLSLSELHPRVENPVVLWEKDGAVTRKLAEGEPRWRFPELQWIEDRVWTWFHYEAVKIGRGELFEALGGLDFLRERVLGPLVLREAGRLPRGVRRIESYAPDRVPDLVRTHSASVDAVSCAEALRAIVDLYVELRDKVAPSSLVRHEQAEQAVRAYVKEIRRLVANPA